MADPPTGADPESRAIEALWRESSARLRAWFARRTGSASDADDLLQETFLRVQEGLDTVLATASVRAWIGTLARNVLHDHWRRRGSPVSTALAAEEEPAAAPDEPASLDRTVAGWLEDFLEELDPADAEALRLADLEGHTQDELARHLGLSLSGAKSRVQRARAKLRARLEACCAFAFDARGGILSAERRARRASDEDCSACGEGSSESC